MEKSLIEDSVGRRCLLFAGFLFDESLCGYSYQREGVGD